MTIHCKDIIDVAIISINRQTFTSLTIPGSVTHSHLGLRLQGCWHQSMKQYVVVEHLLLVRSLPPAACSWSSWQHRPLSVVLLSFCSITLSSVFWTLPGWVKILQKEYTTRRSKQMWGSLNVFVLHLNVLMTAKLKVVRCILSRNVCKLI